jgi:hypothetical protein
VIFLSSGVGGVDAFEEKITVPMDNRVLKVAERGRYGGEVVLSEVVLKSFDAILLPEGGVAVMVG